MNTSSNNLFKVFFFRFFKVALRLNFSSGQHFSLLCSSRFFNLSLQLLLSFSFRISLWQNSCSSEPVVGLILDQVLLVIVSQNKAGGSISSEGSLESEEDKVFSLPFVFIGDKFFQIFLGDVGLAFMIDIEKKFSSGEQFVDFQSSGLYGNGHNLIQLFINIKLLPTIKASTFRAATNAIRFIKPTPKPINSRDKIFIYNFYCLIVQIGADSSLALSLQLNLITAIQSKPLQQLRMEYTYFFMRHAESAHNVEKQNYRKNSIDKSYKKTDNYKQFKLSSHLIDPNCIVQQPLNAKDLLPLDIDRIALILCSPLKRCLLTCQQLLNSRNDIPVIVEPNLSSRLCAAWSIGSSANYLASQFPKFDFTRFAGKEDTWMFDFLAKNKILYQDIIKNKHRLSEYLLEQFSLQKVESYLQFLIRCRSLPGKIREIVSGLKPEAKRDQILIISHSCTLKYMVCQEFDETGKAKCKVSFQHCRPKLCASDLLFRHEAKL